MRTNLAVLHLSPLLALTTLLNLLTLLALCILLTSATPEPNHLPSSTSPHALHPRTPLRKAGWSSSSFSYPSSGPSRCEYIIYDRQPGPRSYHVFLWLPGWGRHRCVHGLTEFVQSTCRHVDMMLGNVWQYPFHERETGVCHSFYNVYRRGVSQRTGFDLPLPVTGAQWELECVLDALMCWNPEGEWPKECVHNPNVVEG